MKPVGIETASEVYRTAYRAAIDAGKNRSKACIREYKKLGEIGTQNPMNTQMLIRRAKKDYLHDLSHVECDPISLICQTFNYYKTMLSLNIHKSYRSTKKAIKDSAKELYPRTHKQRTKLISEGKVSIKSTSDTTTRLNNMNIKPESIINFE